MKTILRVLAILIILAAGGAAAYWFLVLGHGFPTLSAAGHWPGGTGGQIRVSGNIETTEVQIAFKIAGRVEQRRFDEGQKVKKGAVAVLDTADLQCNVALRRPRCRLPRRRRPSCWPARARGYRGGRGGLEKGRRGPGRSGGRLAAAGDRRRRGGREAAAADMERSQADYRRDESLFQRKTISAEEFDAARAAYDMAVQRHRQAEEQLSLTREGLRKEQIEQARWAPTRRRPSTIW